MTPGEQCWMCEGYGTYVPSEQPPDWVEEDNAAIAKKNGWNLWGD